MTREHVRITHTNCEESHCIICDGGLFICSVCSLFEGALTTECPGVESYLEHSDAVYAGHRDFIGGKWVENAVSIHAPASVQGKK